MMLIQEKRNVLYWGTILLCFICMNANAAVSLGPPFETDPAEPYFYDMYASDIVGAGGDGEGLVVFEDGGTIWAMPFDETGAAAAPQVIELSPTEPANEYYYPSVAYGDGIYLAGWSLHGVAVQRVSPLGELIGDLIWLDDDGYFPGIVWDGSSFLVAWETITDSDREIAFAKINTDGTVQTNQTVTDVTDATQPAIAQVNGVSLMAWFANPETQSTGIYGVMVDSDGEAIGHVFQISTENSGHDVRVSSDGNRYLVVWQDGNSLFGRVLESPSEMTDVFEIAQGGSVSSPVVAFDGTDYGILYKDYQPQNQIVFTRVSPDGAPVGEPTKAGFVYQNAATMPALIPFNGGYYVGFQGESGVLGVVTDDGLSPTTVEVGLSLIPHPQSSANVIFNGSDYIISFTDEREGDQIFSTHAVRVSQEGSVREDEALHISDAEHRGFYEVIATLGNGDAVVAWFLREAPVGQMTRVIHGDGTLGEMIAISEAGTNSISIAAGDDQYLVVSVDNSLSPDSYLAMGQFVDSGGQPAGDAFELWTQASYLTASVKPAQEGYLMFYRDGATYGMPIDENGQSGDTFTLAPASALVQTVMNDTQTLVIWSEAGQVRYGQFYENGQLIGEKFVITSDGGFGDAMWDGQRFVAVWVDSKDATHLRYIATNGELGPIEQLFEEDECFGPKIASNGAGQLLLSCVSYRNRYGSSRLANYLIGAPVGDPITEDTDTIEVQVEDSDSETPVVIDVDSDSLGNDTGDDGIDGTAESETDDWLATDSSRGTTTDDNTDSTGDDTGTNTGGPHPLQSDSDSGCTIAPTFHCSTSLINFIFRLITG